MVLVILVQALVSGYVLRGAFLDNLETDLAREARGFAVALSATVPATGTRRRGTAVGATLTDPAALEEFARRMDAATATRITVIAHDGTVLADSEEDPALMENHRGRPEVATALAGSEGRARRVSATLKQEMLYVAVPIEAGDLPWSSGVVRVAVPASRVDPLLGHVLRAAAPGGPAPPGADPPAGLPGVPIVHPAHRVPAHDGGRGGRRRPVPPRGPAPLGRAGPAGTGPQPHGRRDWRAGSPVWRPKRSSPPRSLPR